jgi:DNA helicase HerA-like ATPase
MVNRHGLIARAPGTGKTKTLQALAEQLSAAGVPVFVAHVKGDLSGLAQPGDAEGAAAKRDAELGVALEPSGFPVEYLALGGIGAGVPVRATVSDLGPQLLAKVLDANETQEQSLGLVFRHAEQKQLPLLELADLRALLTFLSSGDGKGELEGISGLFSQTVGVLLRALVTLEDVGGNELFGEPQFAVVPEQICELSRPRRRLARSTTRPRVRSPAARARWAPSCGRGRASSSRRRSSAAPSAG